MFAGVSRIFDFDVLVLQLGPKISFEQVSYPLQSVEKGFEVKIVALEHFAAELCAGLFDLASTADAIALDSLKVGDNLQKAGVQLFVEISLGLGSVVTETLRSSVRSVPMWAEWLRSDRINWNLLPRETRMAVQVFAIRPDKSKTKAALLGWGQFLIFDRLGFLRTGKQKLKLWLGSTPPPPSTKLTQAVLPENPDAKALVLHFEIESPPSGHAVAFVPDIFKHARARPIQLTKPEKVIEEKIERLCRYDPTQELSAEEKTVMWQHRHWVQSLAIPNSLIRLCEATDFFDPAAVRELHYIVGTWGTLPAGEAIELLGSSIGDSVVRRFAVRCLRALEDEELIFYMLQICHVLEFEAWHDSDLARFLLERSLRSRALVGHRFFWHLIASLSPRTLTRFGLYLECYLSNCAEQLPRLIYQRQVFVALKGIATQVSAATSKAKRASILQTELQSLAPLSRSLIMPHRSTLTAQRIVVEKCRFMDSAASPLWLVFENTDTSSSRLNTFAIIFKAGDDLRQDILVMQMISLMDSYWKRDGMDLYMTTYGCVATGPSEGIIEVVPNATTVARIQKEFGGAAAAFSKEPLARWLQTVNPGVRDLSEAVDHFAMSLAGFCVASFLLGFADRHNDNIMICQSGNFFHIDFAQCVASSRFFFQLLLTVLVDLAFWDTF
jgi:phosphatidylinositol-4,5-bisphosphate 3-kinase catalytic subunit alpha/beta/delta